MFKKKKYPPNWLQIRHEILRRAKDRCEGSPLYPNCRAKNHYAHPETGSDVVLTIAHMDHNTKNNDFFNLKALCQRCHLLHDIKNHVKNRKINELEAAELQGQLKLF